MKKIFFAIFVLVAAAVSLNAQSRTSYFVKNSTQNHYLNPAFVPDQGYMGVPLLNSFDIQIGTNFGPSSFLFPLADGKTGLFLNPEVDADVFMAGLKSTSYLDGNIGYNIVDAGWFTGKDSFWTLSLGVDADVESSVPKELFGFLKRGMETDPQQYSIRNLSLGAQVYASLSLGYSRGLDELVKGLRVGGKVKFLASVADIQVNMNSLDLNMSSQKWNVSTLGTAHILGGGIVPTFNEDGYVNGLKFDPSGLGAGGFGMAFDLGAEYTISEGTPVDGLRFSISVTDLGFISYNKSKSRIFRADRAFEYDGFENIGGDEGLESQVENLQDELFGLVSFSEEQVDKAQSGHLAATLYAGVDYSFLNDKMNVGLLYSVRFGRFRTENELTLAWNYAPVRSFDIALSYSLLKTHSTFGWLITFVPRKGIGIFVGSDYTPLNYTAFNLDGFKLPVPSRQVILDVNFGLTISLGGTNRRY